MTFPIASRLAIMVLAATGMASSSWGQVVTTYVYDPQGQVTSVVRPSQTVGYRYDQAANRAAMTVSGGSAMMSAPDAKSSTLQSAAPTSVSSSSTSDIQTIIAEAKALAHARAAPIAVEDAARPPAKSDR